jgi:hypothetical protein
LNASVTTDRSSGSFCRDDVLDVILCPRQSGVGITASMQERQFVGVSDEKRNLARFKKLAKRLTRSFDD